MRRPSEPFGEASRSGNQKKLRKSEDLELDVFRYPELKAYGGWESERQL